MTKIISKAGSYNQKVVKCFKNPKNYGQIKNPDGVGEVGNPVCGDVMKLYIKVAKNKKGEEIVKDIKFETFGCVAAIATSSILTQIAKGKTLKEALKIDNKKIIKSLGGLPPIKVHCSVLAANALKKAIGDYYSRNDSKKNE
ncbi:MAG: iron-sulfur cluster assembly scaffold protein [Patescibacteria group bacterium]|nr:iron-sulfur cluster assembly scaffold protein [Patescibacteria group bacterium]MBU1877064.1 iron-sulfur cluster assembly scaffold protein [Patescibacteria group bacterium]